MNNRQENRFTMILNVYDSCMDFATVWQGHEAFVAAFDEFSDVRSRIMDAQLIQGKPTRGITATKAIASHEAVKYTLMVAKALMAYAETVGDTTLASLADITASDFYNMRDADKPALFRRILNEAASLVQSAPSMTRYGLTANVVNTLEDKISSYESVLTAPRQAIGYRAAATAQIQLLISKATRILKKKLDGLMEQFSTGYPEFYDHYFRMRMIVDYGTGSGEIVSESGEISEVAA